MRIIVTTSPFSKTDKAPKEQLQKISKDVMIFDGAKKITPKEHEEMLSYDPDIIIAGTEKYDKITLSKCKNLKMISRVGIGVDGIDHDECKKRGIVVANTPDAPSNAVAELAVLQMLNMLRKVQQISNDLHSKMEWNRYIGRELSDCNVGIIGCGRCGSLVAKKIIGFGCKIFVNDIDKDKQNKICNYRKDKIIGSTYDYIYKNCDIITIHIPLENNKDFISLNELEKLKPYVRLLNLSRGGIINEKDLYNWLCKNKKACAAIDAFEHEAYNGELIKLGNAYLTPHIGSCTKKSRLNMELGAVLNAKKFIDGEEICNQFV